ncbi:o-succinylbenzoate synthase [Canibacter sp. lx-45]|uniref:o-succinylbenzoate synthase n=1 Tax=Canibacter zhuwentaonis TaxID=2837491 RepID=UPI001BDBC25E|nr:o-succinylbenzoate synthase [Canibacter zhuwentaonis]MBT1035959.1 o-succinylbenzoate synthase [Canibacter zhuwentaonis]
MRTSENPLKNAFADGAAAPQRAALPPLAELQERAQLVRLPLNTRFRGVINREIMIFKGAERDCEFAPFPEYNTASAAPWLAAAIAYGWHKIPAPRRRIIAVNATVPAVNAAHVPEVLARFTGCTTVKVKVAERGQTLADDIARVRAVREALGTNALIRVDANGAWSVPEATAALRALAEFTVDYAEQPCKSVAELSKLKKQLVKAGINTLIAADESVRHAHDPLLVARAKAADLLVIKAAPLGGIARALQITVAAGLPVVVSSALDSSIGVGMGARLAAALPDNALYGACGLGTTALFKADVCEPHLSSQHGFIDATTPITADPARLEALKAPPHREKWWRQRLSDCYQFLLQSQ